MSTVRTRFAPSPTGYMHIGSLRTALYAYLFAKKQGGDFLVRIEDTDQVREMAGAVQGILDCLQFFNLKEDEGPLSGGPVGPYIQSQRKDLYAREAWALVDAGLAYPCFCTKERLDAAREAMTAAGGTWQYDRHCAELPPAQARARAQAGESFCIRQRVPDSGSVTFEDLLLGPVTVDCDQLDDMVLLKADGFPTYNFANVVDDHLMGITHVLRGSEFVSSSPKHILLYQAFGWQPPQFVHLPLIMATPTRKLSKRHGDPTVDDLLRQGFLPEAIVNYIALLGWSPGDDREFFTLEELQEAFSLAGISRSPALFDLEKLTWFNASYIRMLPLQIFSQNLISNAGPHDLKRLPQDLLTLLAEQLQPRVERFCQIPDLLDLVFHPVLPVDPALYDHKKMKTDAALAARILPLAHEALAALPTPLWEDAPAFLQEARAALTAVAEGLEIKPGAVLFTLRAALSGRPMTPCGALELALFAGREDALRRLVS